MIKITCIFLGTAFLLEKCILFLSFVFSSKIKIRNTKTNFILHLISVWLTL